MPSGEWRKSHGGLSGEIQTMCGLKSLNKNSTAYSRTVAPEKDGGFL
jgi:hypothetical protein